MSTKTNKLKMNRRRFFGASAVATMGFQVVPSRVFGANSRLAVAGIGAGGKGRAEIVFNDTERADRVNIYWRDTRREGAQHHVNTLWELR